MRKEEEVGRKNNWEEEHWWYLQPRRTLTEKGRCLSSTKMAHQKQKRISFCCNHLFRRFSFSEHVVLFLLQNSDVADANFSLKDLSLSKSHSTCQKEHEYSLILFWKDSVFQQKTISAHSDNVLTAVCSVKLKHIAAYEFQ